MLPMGDLTPDDLEPVLYQHSAVINYFLSFDS